MHSICLGFNVFQRYAVMLIGFYATKNAFFFLFILFKFVFEKLFDLWKIYTQSKKFELRIESPKFSETG